MKINRLTLITADLDAALTMVKIAEGASDVRKKARNEEDARRALDTFRNLYRQPEPLTDDERKVVEEKVTALRAVPKRLCSRAT